jgi:hypothetical protein
MAAPEPRPAVQDGDTAFTARAEEPGPVPTKMNRRCVEDHPFLNLLAAQGAGQPDAVAVAVDGDRAGDMATSGPTDRA